MILFSNRIFPILFFFLSTYFYNIYPETCANSPSILEEFDELYFGNQHNDFFSSIDKKKLINGDTVIQKQEKEILWSADRKLKWSDFKGKPNKNTKGSSAALTSAGLFLRSDSVYSTERPQFIIENKFVCYRSWVDPSVDTTKGKSQKLLKHEQGHFDISEIYKRKLVNAINNADIVGSNLKQQSQKLYNDIYQQLLNKQTQYDIQTEHGTNDEEQAKWNEYIDKSLK